MKVLKSILVAASLATGLAAMLAGCGGSGSAFESAPAVSTTAVTKIDVASSLATISADGSNKATITGTLLNSAGNPVVGSTATFASTAGTITPVTSTSDSSGHVTATLVAGTATVGTSINVTVTSGAVTSSQPANVTVVAGTRKVTLTSSLANIPSDGSKAANIVALVVDATNNVVAGVPVLIQADSGTLMSVPSKEQGAVAGETDSTGTVTSTLTAGDQTNRTITVTATVAGDPPATLQVGVTGTTLSLTGSASIVAGSPGTYTATLTDSSGAGISGKVVTFSSANKNTLSASTVKTNPTGQATVTMSATTSGNDTLTATALGLTATQAVTVSSQRFAFTSPPPPPATPVKVDIDTNSTVSVTWTSSGAPVSGATVVFAATRGSIVGSATATTDSNGVATATLTSKQSGLSTITATGTTATGANAGTTVVASTVVDFLATMPTQVILQPSVTSVAAQGSATIVAVVRQAVCLIVQDPCPNEFLTYNLVENQTVEFNLVDPTGGTLSVPSAVTDGQGRAQTVYTASSTGSATQGVQITASVLNFSNVFASTALTVGGQSVFLALGTGNTISETADNVQYIDPWVVRAIDASGHAVASQNVTLQVVSLDYIKGYYEKNPNPNADQTHYFGVNTVTCQSEDLNNNGSLDPGEDVNGNKNLDPGYVAVPIPADGTTDATGAVSFSVYYPKDRCNWVKVRLSASTIVNGTQSTSTSEFVLPCALSDLVIGGTLPPPGVNSLLQGPYGADSVCTDTN